MTKITVKTAIVTMNLADLRGLAVYARAALDHPNRPELHGIHFRPAGYGAESAASNGYGLALLSIPGAAVKGTLPTAHQEPNKTAAATASSGASGSARPGSPPLWRENTELRQVASQRVDRLRPLAYGVG